MYRHGDVMIARVTALPEGAVERNGVTLARGELTGHSHRIRDFQHAKLYEHDAQTYLEVLTDTAVIHEEHHAIVLEKGMYRVWMQREYSPEAIRTVRD
ncbi:MAG: hypothetical protein HC933_12060 [Pleurocapsa sp. SU_196_0]|nr:hypothetical protein [Pleurocapsa sp. SU_196_0]